MSSQRDNELKVAIVTRLDERYIYIWASHMGLYELRFPFKSIPNIEPGDSVWYRQTDDPRGVQYQKDIYRNTTGITMEVKRIRDIPKIHFIVKTMLVFPPRSYAPYCEIVEKSESCKAIAFSLEFRKVALFKNLEPPPKPNVVYEGYICRIPTRSELIAQEVQTLFCIAPLCKTNELEKVLEIIEDETRVTEALTNTPWYIPPNNDIDEDFEAEDMLGITTANSRPHIRTNNDAFYGNCDDDKYGANGHDHRYPPVSSSVSGSRRPPLDERDARFYDGEHSSTAAKQRQYDQSSRFQTKEQKLIDLGEEENDFYCSKSSRSKEDEEVAKYADSTRYGGKSESGKSLANGAGFSEGFQRSNASIERDVTGDFSTTYRGRADNHEGFGVIVRLEPEYAVIWSPSHDLICAAGTGRDKPLGTWVTFKCFEDHLSVENGHLKKSAYELNDIKPKRLSYKFEDSVKCKAIVRLMPKSDNEFFLLTVDDVLGVVLCSRDPFLLKQFKRNVEVEVFVIYMEDYQKPSRWIAIAANHGNNDWRMLERLPDRANELAERAFSQRSSRVDEDYGVGRTNPTEFSEPKYGPPENWHSVIHESERKIREVLGIVVCHESNREVSVIATVFGLARLPAFLDMGTWLRMVITEDVDGERYQNMAVWTEKNYVVRQSNKILPPMSTRVVNAEQKDRILLCGVIVRGHRCFENTYIGQVFDKKELVKLDPERPPNPNGFLVEIGFLESRNGWYWGVLKCHGAAIKNVDHVPLQLSIFPHFVGRTCDDPHTLLMDPHYVDPAHSGNGSLRSERVASPPPSFGRSGEKPESGIPPNSGGVNPTAHARAQPQDDLRVEYEDLRKLSPTQWLFGNDRKSGVAEELRRYKPNIGGIKTKGMCLVTRKSDTFALAYSKKFRIILIKADQFRDVDEFHEICQPSKWIDATIVKVVPQDDDYSGELQYRYVTIPPINRTTRNAPETRVLNDFVQVYINCKFDDDTVQRVSEEPSQLVASTALGNVLISEFLYKRHELHDSEQSLWVTHIRERHGCFWKFVLADMLVKYDHAYFNRDQEDFSPEYSHNQRDESRRRDQMQAQDLLSDFGLSGASSKPERIGSIFSAKLNPQELLASFGAKDILHADSSAADHREWERKNCQNARLPAISELAMEELALLKRRQESDETPKPVVPEKEEKSKLDNEIVSPMQKPTGIYYYKEAEEEVARMNSQEISTAMHFETLGKGWDPKMFWDPSTNSTRRNAELVTEAGSGGDAGPVDDYSSPEIISAKNSVATSSTSTGGGERPRSSSALGTPFSMLSAELGMSNAESMGLRRCSSVSGCEKSGSELVEDDEYDESRSIGDRTESAHSVAEDKEWDRALERDDQLTADVLEVKTSDHTIASGMNDLSLGTHKWISVQNYPA